MEEISLLERLERWATWAEAQLREKGDAAPLRKKEETN